MSQEAQEIPHSLPQGKEGVKQSMGENKRVAQRRGIVNFDSHSLTPMSGHCCIHLLWTMCLRFPFSPPKGPWMRPVSPPLGRLPSLLGWPSWAWFLSAPDFVAIFIFLKNILKASFHSWNLELIFIGSLCWARRCALLRHHTVSKNVWKKFQ